MSGPIKAYAVPTEYPKYVQKPHKIDGGKRFGIYALLDIFFVVAASLLTVAFAGLLAFKSFEWSWSALLYLILTWGLLAYVALPRIHQLLTSLYVPDYFMGRTRTGDGMLGDPVNLALDGTEADIHAAMQAAGWVKADEITLRSAWGIVVSSVLRRSYPEAPVSSLFLFGKRHQFAYQQEVDGNAAQRHHVRFWQVPEGWVLPGGHRVQWLAAGTYDRAVGLSIFTGQITHKIDANIDLERDYIIDSVRFTDPDCTVRVIEDFSTAYHHRNGGGDPVQTDGALPVLNVAGAAERAESKGVHVNLDESAGATTSSVSKGVNKSGHVAALNAAGEDLVTRRIPPFGLLIAGLLVFIQLLFILLIWVMFLVVDPAETLSESGTDLASFLVITGVMVAVAVMVVLSFAHSKWARIGLMGTLTMFAALDLLSSVTSDGMSFSSIMTTGFSVLVVWAVSGDEVREWVLNRRVKS